MSFHLFMHKRVIDPVAAVFDIQIIIQTDVLVCTLLNGVRKDIEAKTLGMYNLDFRVFFRD